MLDAPITPIHRTALNRNRGFAGPCLQPLSWDNQFS
jgi:hypothetical protein